jgi:Type I phosphodiesterase / nucleotide pyrophosphatase
VAELINFDFPNRKATPLTEVLEDTDEAPKLVVTAVIDGGGWNVLRKHPDSWPNLKRLMEEGTNIDNAIVGSSPSITPAVHTNIGTGVFPRQHGVTAIVVRERDGNLAGAFSGDDDIIGVRLVNPTINLRKTTVADEYDLATNNEAKIALVSPGTYQLGMIGRGAAMTGGDHDISPMLAKVDQRWETNPEFYSAPDYINDDVEGPAADLEAVDRSDGEADGKWRGHEIPPVVATPALAPWENRIIKSIIENEGFGQDDVTDLLSINYKAPDSLGHLYNMNSPEEAETLASADAALGDLVEYLDSRVGEGEYVVILTADHGQTPLDAGGWPIHRDEIRADIDGRFDKIDNGVAVLEQTSASSFFMRKAEMKENGVTPERIASFLTDYTIGDNIPDGDEIPEGFEERLEEPIFDAVIPGRKITKVARCTGALEG